MALVHVIAFAFVFGIGVQYMNCYLDAAIFANHGKGRAMELPLWVTAAVALVYLLHLVITIIGNLLRPLQVQHFLHLHEVTIGSINNNYVIKFT